MTKFLLSWVKAGVDLDYLQYLMKRVMTYWMIRLDSVVTLRVEERGVVLVVTYLGAKAMVGLVVGWERLVFLLGLLLGRKRISQVPV
jgi:hypothetical protein